MGHTTLRPQERSVINYTNIAKAIQAKQGKRDATAGNHDRQKRRKISLPETGVHGSTEHDFSSTRSQSVVLIESRIEIDLDSFNAHQGFHDIWEQLEYHTSAFQIPVAVTHKSSNGLQININSVATGSCLLHLSCNSGDFGTMLSELNWAEKVASANRLVDGNPKRVPEFHSSIKLNFQRVSPVSELVWVEISVRMMANNTWTKRSLALTEHWYPLIALGLPNGGPEVDNPKAVTARDFYDSVFHPPKQDVPSAVQHPGLDCLLLPFQRRAVRWMLRREGYDIQHGSDAVVPYKQDLDEFNPPLFFKEVDRKGNKCWVSHILGIVSVDVSALLMNHEQYRGGILAEEMGLGKTVELIALIHLNRRPNPTTSSEFDSYSGNLVKSSSATLIITPASILHQWQSELNVHAPGLKVLHYRGIRKQTVDLAVDELLQYDVVLTTYDVLSSEIYFATSTPDRNLRQEVKRYTAKKSPLVGISWWRICLDEAQMVESGVSNAATVARLIPRRNAWAVTGTPVRKDIRDLLGLLIFLRYEPFCRNNQAWKYLTMYNKPCFESLFNSFTLRHTKDVVRDEIHLPPQTRVVVTVPYSQIEEQNYNALFDSMCQECGISSDGVLEPSVGNLEGTNIEKMKTWLVRLRQTCTHPEVGSGNKKALGGVGGPLRTVNEVLEIMIEQQENHLRTQERLLLNLMLKRGQMLEYYKKVDAAMEVYVYVLSRARRVIAECREHLGVEQKGVGNRFTSLKNEGKGKGKEKVVEVGYVVGEEGGGEVTQNEAPTGHPFNHGAWRLRLRSFLEVEHAASFFIGSIYFQMKTEQEKLRNESLVSEYGQKETEFYERAKSMRKEILAETEGRTQKLLGEIRGRAESQQFCEIPETVLTVSAGIETRTVMDDLNLLKEALDSQAGFLDEWREYLIQLLLQPLIDEGEEASGGEFEDTVNNQEKAIAYLEAIKALVADREAALTGRTNMLIEEDIKRAMARKEAHSELLRKLISQRNALKPQIVAPPMRELLVRLRTLLTTLKQQENDGNDRAGAERQVAEAELKSLQDMQSAQVKAVLELAREIELYRDTINARVEFYRQLQTISDTVEAYDPFKEQVAPQFSEEVLQRMKQTEEKIASKVAQGRSKERYLSHLKSNSSGEERQCIICQCNFEVGSLTVCGHQYCKECLLAWFRSHRSCPMCKRGLRADDIHPIAYIPDEVQFRQERPVPSTVDNAVRSIYNDINISMLQEIKLIDLPVSFGSKIDMVCRHILWIRKKHPEEKSVIFSQWRDVLYVLERAFTENAIGFCNMTGNGVNQFKTDPKIECFLLHAKSQSAGLTLVNATNVFICEPLLNTGLELQAISRVHRIGQTKPTTVWVYVMSGTVEESILRLATKRRLAMIGEQPASSFEEITLITESKLDTANSLELRIQGALVEKTAGGGEIVGSEDLWECLVVASKKRVLSTALEKEVKRHLFATAAESRIADTIELPLAGGPSTS